MLLSIFQTTLIRSAGGGIIAFILLVLKPFTRRIFSAKLQYYIWLLVLLFMIFPFSLEPLSDNISMLSTPAVEISKPVGLIQNENKAFKPQNTINVNHTQNNDNVLNNSKIAEVNPSMNNKIYYIAIAVWISGAAAFLLFNIISYIIFLNKIRKNSETVCKCPELSECKQKLKIRRKISILVSPLVVSPVLYGILSPKIVIPDCGVQGENLSLVLLHELTHYKRKDLIYKWIAMLISALHWFNPLIHLVIKNISEDGEISCDLAVTKNMSDKNKETYMKAILTLISRNKTRKLLLTSAMASNKEQIIRRFVMIKNAGKKSLLIKMLSVIMIAAILTVELFTGSAIAAINKEGLEYWPENEIYYKGSFKFSVNVSGKDIPAWVNEIAGSDGNIDVSVTRIQIRDMKGLVNNDVLLLLKGTKGETKLSASQFGGQSLNPSDTIYRNKKLNKQPIVIMSDFCEFNNKGNSSFRSSPVASMVSPNSGQRRYVAIDLGCSKDKKVNFASIAFDIADENDNVVYPYNKFANLETDKIRFSEGFEKYLFNEPDDAFSEIFTLNETDYKNRKVDGIDISISEASTEKIVLNADISLSNITSYTADVYDENGKYIPGTNTYTKIKKKIVVIESKEPYVEKRGKSSLRHNGLTIISGKTYRIDIGLFDKDYNLVYRQREYAAVR